MSRFCIAALVSLLSLQSCFAAVYSGTISGVSLVPGIGSTYFGRLTNAGEGITAPFGEIVDISNAAPGSGSYTNQLKVAKTAQGSAAIVAWGNGAISDSVAWKDDLGLQFVALSQVTVAGTSPGSEILTQGSFLFSISKDANYAILFGAGNNSSFVSGSSSIVLYDSANNAISATGGVLTAGNYKVDFASIAGPGVASKAMGFTLNLTEVSAGPPVVPEPASLAIFGSLGFVGFVARRFRKK